LKLKITKTIVLSGSLQCGKSQFEKLKGEDKSSRICGEINLKRS